MATLPEAIELQIVTPERHVLQETVQSVEIPGKDLPVIRDGRDWGLYSLRSTTRSVDPRAQIGRASCRERV